MHVEGTGLLLVLLFLIKVPCTSKFRVLCEFYISFSLEKMPTGAVYHMPRELSSCAAKFVSVSLSWVGIQMVAIGP